jgi:thioredoxin-dependent peroxiredoxin
MSYIQQAQINDDGDLLKGLKEGDNAPVFKLPDQDGKEIDMAERIGKKVLVIYFYPKDFTSGCTMEAHAFREMYEAFQKEGAEIFGISGDSVESHKKFAVEHELPFELLSDKGNKVRDLYGAYGIAHTVGRVTYVVDKKGVINMVFSSNIQPKEHVEESIKKVRELSKV